jgi:hypothetical protein
MKWIKDRRSFLNEEAKIKDVILHRQKKAVISQWGERFLDYEEVEPTKNIKQGKWKLSEEDKLKVLGTFFSPVRTPIDFKSIFDKFKNLPDHFKKIIKDSIDIEKYNNEKYKIIMENFDPSNPTIDQISLLYDPIFRRLAIRETMSAEMLQKDENGRPIRGEDGKILKVEKEPGEPIWEKNLVNIKNFTDYYNRCYEDTHEKVDTQLFYTNDISNFISLSKENHNAQYKIDFEILNKDIYLSINHKASDILNMSISTFYGSCQHLYGGSYREQLLGNVFDPNSIPAFLIFDTPIYWEDDKISDFLPLSRMIIRNIESFNILIE